MENEKSKLIKYITDNERGGDSFIVLMTSLSVIMLAFFILLNAIAVIDDQRVLRAYGSLIGAFHILPGGYLAQKGAGTGLSFPGPPITDLNDFFKSILNKFEENLYKDGFGESVSVLMSKKGVSVTIDSDVAFDPGSATLSVEGMEVLHRIVRIIKQVPNKVQIEGHTDSSAIKTDKYSSNWDLSVERALNTLLYFIEDEGIDERRLSISGYADSKKVSDDPLYVQRNRRISITLINKK